MPVSTRTSQPSRFSSRTMARRRMAGAPDSGARYLVSTSTRRNGGALLRARTPGRRRGRPSWPVVLVRPCRRPVFTPRRPRPPRPPRQCAPHQLRQPWEVVGEVPPVRSERALHVDVGVEQPHVNAPADEQLGEQHVPGSHVRRLRGSSGVVNLHCAPPVPTLSRLRPRRETAVSNRAESRRNASQTPAVGGANPDTFDNRSRFPHIDLTEVASKPEMLVGRLGKRLDAITVPRT